MNSGTDGRTDRRTLYALHRACKPTECTNDIFSQFVATTCFGRVWPSCALCGGRPRHSAHSSTQGILNIYTQLFNLFNFNFNYQRTTRCLDCGEYIYKQLHLGRIDISLYYLLCNSAP
jgi:hypothetical protein